MEYALGTRDLDTIFIFNMLIHSVIYASTYTLVVCSTSLAFFFLVANMNNAISLLVDIHQKH